MGLFIKISVFRRKGYKQDNTSSKGVDFASKLRDIRKEESLSWKSLNKFFPFPLRMFQNRPEAARLLAQKLMQYKNKKNVLILAIPRGGLEVGNIIAKKLQAPLDIILTKKIGYPGEPEAAIGAVSLTGYHVEDKFFINQGYIQSQVKEIQVLLRKRYHDYLGKRKPFPVKGKAVILVDDGVATGSTIIEAINILRKEKPKKIIVAIPVGPEEVLAPLRQKADEIICLQEEPLGRFFAIGRFYRQFEQVSEEEAKRMLKGAEREYKKLKKK